jgi:hypothetical protein
MDRVTRWSYLLNPAFDNPDESGVLIYLACRRRKRNASALASDGNGIHILLLKATRDPLGGIIPRLLIRLDALNCAPQRLR